MDMRTLTKLEKDYIDEEAISFIYRIMRDKKLNRKVDLSYINVNDWESRHIRVFVGNKSYPFKYRKYKRFSDYDVKNAIKFHFKDLYK